jgi:hypothetical protein
MLLAYTNKCLKGSCHKGASYFLSHILLVLFIVAADSLAYLDNLVDGYIENATFAAVATVILRVETGYV